VPLIPEVTLPGLSFPGIATIGPAFDIFGQITGEVIADGVFGVGATINSPPNFFAAALVGDSSIPATLPSVQITPSFTITPVADVSLQGNLAIHVIPEVALVCSFFCKLAYDFRGLHGSFYS
jgi:hypothetical protein